MAKLERLDPASAIRIMGKKVRSAAGEDMGRIVDLLCDEAGQPRAAVIDFGGFLGVGSRRIAIDWRGLRFSHTEKDSTVTLDLTRDQIKSAPEYKDADQPVAVVTLPKDTPEGTEGDPNR